MRYLIKFSYDGTNFYGYQKQPSKRTVENEFEKALFNINNHTITKIVGAGRTDAGVHAKCQCAHFDLSVNITLPKLKRALNSFLPKDIHVFEVVNVNDDFHARYMVKNKVYKYYLNVGEYNPIEKNYIYQYNKALNIERMEEAIKYFVGIHDFQGFVSEEDKKENYVREIFEAKIEENEEIITFSFKGTGFMKYQVRNMVGVLVKIGANNKEPNIIKEIFDDPSKSNFAKTIKPEGLYLWDIEY